ncbi:putative PWI domain-containing protein [Helianthus debilis subsp. tardiflorus]
MTSLNVPVLVVDMTKVKMDVMRPWIAHRVTELLGFEDEVLTNFIYGLLEEKVTCYFMWFNKNSICTIFMPYKLELFSVQYMLLVRGYLCLRNGLFVIRILVVNGKEIQISLTGFMEKNTGKFMKELWTHLLSAQQNKSGVPQQFLDAKEEETKKKQVYVQFC